MNSPAADEDESVVAPAMPSPGEALRAWGEVALLSFGGPTAQVAVMHRVIVEERKWVSEERFLHALNFCMLLPGPEAQQLATYLGWLLNGRLGGLLAGGLFILPGAIAILALSFLYVWYHKTVALDGALFGLKCAVVAVVAEAVLRIGKKVLKTKFSVVLAAAAFVAIFFFHAPFPLIILAAAVIGFMRGEEVKGQTSKAKAGKENQLEDITASVWTQLLTLVIFLVLWFSPLIALGFSLGWDHLLVQEGWFFSKAAVVTFGGAYAVLPYVAQQTVERFKWLSPGQMQDGLGLAETTPGPLIMVVQFVGFIAAYQSPEPFPPWLAGILGSAITVWVTFVPSFMWVFVGAPYVESLRKIKQLSSALAAITAAVVGVVLNLAVWFTLNTLFREKLVHVQWDLVNISSNRSFAVHGYWPESWSDFSWPALVLSAVCAVLLLRLKWHLFVVLGIAVAAGLVLRVLEWI